MVELQANRESDKLIARRLGLEIFDMWSFSGESEPGVILDQDKGIESCPYYTTDLNAAITLYSNEPLAQHKQWRNTIKLHFRLTYSLVQDHWECQLDDPLRFIYKRAKTPALAVCQAWWAWRDQYESGEYDNTRREELIQEDQKIRGDKS